MKKVFILLLVTILCTYPVFAAEDKETDENGAFPVEIEDIIECAGVENIAWDDAWNLLVGIESGNGLVAIAEPAENPETTEVMYIYVNELENLSEQLETVFLCTFTSKERKEATVLEKIDISNVYSDYPCAMYSFATKDGHYMADMSVIIDHKLISMIYDISDYTSIDFENTIFQNYLNIAYSIR